MSDSFSRQKRSEIMRSVKSKGNASTEIKLIRIFRNKKITGWRRNYRIFGNPDFVFPKKRIVIFADGCFWHGHNCRNTIPDDNEAYWTEKILRNKQRDKNVSGKLSKGGWQVVRLWECEIKNQNLRKLREVDLIK